MNFENAFNKFIETVMNDFSKAKINDLDKAIDYAINKAYYDMQLRTIKGHNNDIKDQSITVLKDIIKSFFIEKNIYDQTSFDARHKYACDKFLNTFNNEAQKYSVEEQEYGKAQKLLICHSNICIAYSNVIRTRNLMTNKPSLICKCYRALRIRYLSIAICR